MTKSTQAFISGLHPDPEVRQSCAIGVERCNVALTGRAQVILTFSYRTIEQQDALFALGRTKVNPDGKSKLRPLGYKVTNARGGQSIHNYHLAFDIGLLVDNKFYSWDDLKDYDGDGVSDWMECVAIFKDLGWDWGGDWSSIIDKPHFQKTFGLSLGQLQARVAAKDFIPGTTFVNIRNIVPYKTYTTSTAVNLRIGAGTEYGVIQVVAAGARVTEKRRVGDWSQVTFGPNTGWLNNKYLK